MRNACEMQLVLCFISSSGLFIRRNFWINLTVSAVKWRTQSSQFPLAQSPTKVFNYLPMLYRLAKRKRERKKEKHMAARERSIMRGTILVLQFRFCRLPSKIKVSVSVAVAFACNAANFSQSLQLQCKVANLMREAAWKGVQWGEGVGRVL